MQTVKSSVPAINVFLQVLLFRQYFDWKIYATVSLVSNKFCIAHIQVVLGVGASSVTEVNFHMWGFGSALIASFTTGMALNNSM